MECDKDMALHLLDLLQDFYLRILVMQAQLEEIGHFPSAKFQYDWMSREPDTQKNIHAIFEPMRELVLHAPSWQEVVERILSDIPRIDPSGIENQD